MVVCATTSDFSYPMRLFLSVIPSECVSSRADGNASDTIALFDDGVWTRSGPSGDAADGVSAGFVAQEVYRQAALSELLKSTESDVVCFRYGPRPDTVRDFLLFHQQADTLPGIAGRTPPQRLLTPARSPLVTPASSASSCGMERRAVVPCSNRVRNAPARDQTGTLGELPVYDSIAALWLLESVHSAGKQLFASAGLFFVDGSAVDLVSGHAIGLPPSVHAGTRSPLASNKDVHAFLQHCHSAVEGLASASPLLPYHVWINIRVGGSADRAVGGVSVTFLDLGCPRGGPGGPAKADDGGRAAPERRALQEQLRMFDQHLGAAHATSMQASSRPLSPRSPARPTSQRWLGLLQSCRLSRVGRVGIFCLAPPSSEHLFAASVTEMLCDPLGVSAALRQQALEDAVNHGILHPQLPSSRKGRSRALKAKKRAAVESKHEVLHASALLALPYSPISQATPPLPPLRGAPPASPKFRLALPPTQASPTARGGAVQAARTMDLFALLEAEESLGRAALRDGEGRARDLAWLRWVVRAHPLNTSVTGVARELSRTFARLERRQTRSPTRMPTSAVTQVDLAATTRTPFGSSKMLLAAKSASAGKSAATVGHSPSSRSGAAVGETLPSLASSVSRSRAPTQHRMSPQLATNLESRQGTSSRAVSPTCAPSPSRATSGRRRYSALEVALLERVHSAQPSTSPVMSPQNGGEVELLYPLVRFYHAELTAQDSMMAAELMARSEIELREMNRRRRLEAWAAEPVSPTDVSLLLHSYNSRGYSAPAQPSRLFFDP